MRFKKYLYIAFIALTISNPAHSQDGKYIRKSVSSLDAVWIKPGLPNGINIGMLTDFLKFYIEVPRFDFNNLPESQVSNFISKANALSDVSSNSLAKLMEETIVKDILAVLNDPEVKKNRGLALKSESDFNTFAATKAKSLGLTTEELKTLMNSAYIYLPYLSKFEKKDNELTVEGGIIWWQMQVAPNGDISVNEVLNATTEAVSSFTPDPEEDYSKFTFNFKDYQTTASTYIQGDAFIAFANNLGVKTKSLSDFKLQAQIASVSGGNFEVGIGRKEGLFLDDGYFIVELSENSDGETVEVQKAFSRVSKTGENKEDSNNLTEMKKIYGDKAEVGQVIMEHPTLGQNLTLRLGQINLNNKNDDGYDIENYYNFARLGLAYNTAPIVNISQFYLDFSLAYYQTTEELADDETYTIIDLGLGFHKKINAGRLNFPIGIMYKYLLASFEYGADSYYGTYTENATYHMAEFSAGFQYMINQDLMFHVGYYRDIYSQMASYEDSYGNTIDDFEVEEDKIGPKSAYILVGFDYTLQSLPINVFGFLDPFKKY